MQRSLISVPASMIGFVAHYQDRLLGVAIFPFYGVIAMKKSLLALSAAATLAGGLGFVSSAHAIIVKDDAVGSVPATTMAGVQSGGVGHVLFTPYFSTINGNVTLISLVNTDKANGKAVKVRFRGAANSDDILDFTVLMSPGDVWTASIEPSLTGVSRILSPDSTCVLPQQLGTDGVDFRTGRLDQKLSADAQALHTREGYVEYLNMADIKPGTDLFKAIKHKDGVAPCTSSEMAKLMSTDVVTYTDAAGYGLERPTGGLFGNWSIFNNLNITSYGGGHASVRAVDAKGNNKAARLFFAPQKGAATSAADAANNTADPLLVGGEAGVTRNTDFQGVTYAPDAAVAALVPPLWLDLPDLSTPYTQADTSPQARAHDLSESLAAKTIMNEFVATPSTASVPFATDWVFSQPTRRYQTAMAYSTGGVNLPVNATLTAAKRHYKAGTGGNLSVSARTVGTLALGDFLCAKGSFSGTDREEFEAVTSGDFSPVVVAGSAPICGEVATLSFNSDTSKVLNAQLTNARVNVKNASSFVTAGWASLGLDTPTGSSVAGVPVVGYAATSFTNGLTHGNFGDAIAHRYGF